MTRSLKNTKSSLRKNLNNPFAIQNIMKQLNKTPLSEALNEILLQGMRSAYYSTSNIGHYGLGINALKGEAYCHFTSPIRRVMDLIVHMIIKELITDEKYFDKISHNNITTTFHFYYICVINVDINEC